MSDAQHHASCDPESDESLIWQCGQCGLERSATEDYAALQAERDRLQTDLHMANETLGELTAERDGLTAEVDRLLTGLNADGSTFDLHDAVDFILGDLLHAYETNPQLVELKEQKEQWERAAWSRQEAVDNLRAILDRSAARLTALERVATAARQWRAHTDIDTFIAEDKELADAVDALAALAPRRTG